MLLQIGKIIDKFGILPEYIDENNKQISSFGLPNMLKIDDREETNIFLRENLEKLSISRLTVLFSFWINRLVKDIVDMYTSYFIMYQLNLDDREHIEKGYDNMEISQDAFEKLNAKFSFLYLKLNEIYKRIREENKKEGKYDVSSQIEEMKKQNGEQYHKYFSTIGGLHDCENDFEEDFLLCFNLENTVKNFYEKKDEAMLGLLYSLFEGNISENWGIIEEDNPNEGFVLLGADIEGLNMPLRLHISRKMLLQFLQERQKDFIVPMYSGYEDFKLNGRRISTQIMMPLTDKQKKEIEEISLKTSEDNRLYRFIKHIVFLANALCYPEHLKRKKTVIKKGKKKIKSEKIETYIDIKTRKKYIKQNGQFVSFEDDGR